MTLSACSGFLLAAMLSSGGIAAAHAQVAPPITGTGCLEVPSSCAFPDATNTGVFEGVELTPSGSLAIKTPGAVISNLDIYGSVAIYAPNVTIRNTRIVNNGNTVAAVRLYTGASVTIEDSEIDATIAKVAIGYGNYTLRRVEVRGGVDTLRADGNVLIEDSYLHDLTRLSGTHNDIAQTLQGSNITLRHNTLFAFKGTPGSWPLGGDPMNAVFQLGNLSGNVSNVLIENNLVNGGNYTFNANWSSVDQGSYTATNIVIRNNSFGRDYRYGTDAHMDHGVDFSGNVFVETGEPLQDAFRDVGASRLAMAAAQARAARAAPARGATSGERPVRTRR